MPDYIADDYAAIAKAMEQLKFEEHQNEYEITLATASASVNLERLQRQLVTLTNGVYVGSLR